MLTNAYMKLSMSYTVPSTQDRKYRYKFMLSREIKGNISKQGLTSKGDPNSKQDKYSGIAESWSCTLLGGGGGGGGGGVGGGCTWVFRGAHTFVINIRKYS